MYVQPLYLRATSGANIPQLERVIVGQGGWVAMQSTLEESIAELNKLVKAAGAGPSQPSATAAGDQQ